MAQAQHKQELAAAIANALVDRLRAELMKVLRVAAYCVTLLGALASLWLLFRG
jgi:hypothetical protein